jgi:hypothetical protein
VAFAWDVSAALGEPVAAIVPGYGLADVVPQALGGWFGFEFYGVVQTATQNFLAHATPSLAIIGKDLACTTPGRPKASTGAPVFLHGSAASDDVHAILAAVPAITRVVGHSKGALATALLARFLPFEQPLGVSRQFENLDALVHVGLIGFLVPVDLTLAPCLLGAPFGRHLVEEGSVNAPVELVHVHRIEPALQPVVFRPEPGDGLLLLPAFVGVTGVKRFLYP